MDPDALRAADVRWFGSATYTEGADLRLVVARFRNRLHEGGAWLPLQTLPDDLESPDIDAVIRSRIANGQVFLERIELREGVADGRATGAPPLRYLLTNEPLASPRARNLVAFPSEDGDGDVLTEQQFLAAGLTSSDQLAAVRWLPESGFVHQVYVAPQARRRRIGTKLLVAAEMVRAALGDPPLHGGSYRTDLGDALLATAPSDWRPRIEVKTATAPPMTPGE